MANNSDILRYFPDTTRLVLKKAWEVLPQEKRTELETALKGLPLDKNPLNALIDLALIHSKSLLSRHHKVAIIGPANVGKSTLFNQFVKSKTEKAEVSPIPGTTRVNQEADAGIFNIIDTPGADAVGSVGIQEREHALNAADQADFIIMVFDAMQGVKQTELVLYQAILKLKKAHIIVLNKMDLAKKFEEEVINRTATNLGVESIQIIPVSAMKGEGISNITMSIIAADPSMTLALANAMPQYRRKIAWRTITTAGSLSSAIALTPLPVIDFIPLVSTQIGMVVNIARIYQYKITRSRARELIGTFGLGLLGRTLFQQLSKLGNLPGWLLSSAIATSTTVAMGYAAMEWFEKGERISQTKLSELNKELTQKVLARLKSAFKRKPSKKEMKETIVDVLSETVSTVSQTNPDKQ